MLRGQDVVLLLLLVEAPGGASVRSLAGRIGYDVAGTHRSLRRLQQSGLYLPDRGRVPSAQAEEFLLHGVKYIFPATLGGETRGVATAWAAAPLSSLLERGSELPPVWPHALGESRGLAFEPLHPIVPEAALRDQRLWELLALLDAVRAGDARARTLASDLLRERIVT